MSTTEHDVTARQIKHLINLSIDHTTAIDRHQGELDACEEQIRNLYASLPADEAERVRAEFESQCVDDLPFFDGAES